MRVLGIDYGSKRIGVALGDTETRIASPWTVIESHDRAEAVQKISELIAKENVGAVVVGVPHPLIGGHENDQVRETHAFMDMLSSQGLTVHEQDEKLTSKLAAVQMQERGEKGKRDDLAAAAILQDWLDRYVVSS